MISPVELSRWRWRKEAERAAPAIGRSAQAAVEITVHLRALEFDPDVMPPPGLDGSGTCVTTPFISMVCLVLPQPPRFHQLLRFRPAR